MFFTILDHFWTRVFALLIFIVASLTDLYDGYIARKTNTVTDFGKMMDPLVDKFLTSAAFICFVGMGRELQVRPWMVVMIIGRELLVTGLRMLAAVKGEVLPADKQGKIKTAVQISVVIIILIILCVNSFLRRFMHIRPASLLSHAGWPGIFGKILIFSPNWLVFVSMLVTLYSGVLYLYHHRHLYSKDVGLNS